MKATISLRKLTIPVSRRDHVLGPINARATLLEYGDFECPYCGQAHAIITELKEELGDRFCLVYRNFPLTQVHPHAENAAEAAEAAGAQEAFWEMHDLLYQNQDQLEDDNLFGYAEELGLNVPRFVAELQNGAHSERVQEDLLSGTESGVNGTPYFFINGIHYEGPDDFESLRAAITNAEGSRRGR